jgi:intermediate peptidase
MFGWVGARCTLQYTHRVARHWRPGRGASSWPSWASGAQFSSSRGNERGGEPTAGGETGPVGFTGIPGLLDSGDWKRLASETERTCRGLVDDAIMGSVSASTDSVDTVRKLDEISDVLCQTIDAAEFCRHVHHDEAWRRAAHAACGQLGAFVHELNTNYGLYTALCRRLDGVSGARRTDRTTQRDMLQANGNSRNNETKEMAEYRYVGEMLRRDFERFGVHLEGAARDEMTELVALIHQAGHEYMTNSIDGSKTGEIVVDERALRADGGRGLEFPAGWFRRRKHPDGASNLLAAPGDSNTCNGLLVHCDSEEIRRAAFQSYHSFPAENGALAGRILAARHRVASIMGYDSFCAYQLDGFSLGGTPEAVGAFLKGINESIRDGVCSERKALESFKASKASVGTPPAVRNAHQLNPWDRDWAVNGLLDPGSKAAFRRLHSLFRVSGFVSGMSALLEEVMGLRLKMDPLSPGEGWAPGVSRVVVEDSRSGETYGTIYLDLLQRPGKFGGAALFTLRCGRRLSSGEYQLPKVALVANTSPDNNQCLSFGDLETLCHEFGHAMHSILSRTELQHLSGTRGPQDIIEVPSHVFERFASDRRALSLMAQHSGHDAGVITNELMGALIAKRRHCAATKLQKTVQMCLIDHYMHSDSPQRDGFGSKGDIEQFMRERGVAEFDELTEFPPLRFTHIVGYAGNYYSYLFANCIAAQVWGIQGCDGTDGVNGTLGWPSRSSICDKMLSSGGSVPARQYVGDLVGSNGLITMAPTVDGKTGCYPDFRPYLRHLDIINER